MFLEILIALGLGVFLGIFTGIIPGIHVNLICAILLPFAYLFEPFALSVFILTVAVTQVFSDNLHSIFLGAPEEATALSVFPGHRMLLRGEGLLALRIALTGALLGVIISIGLFPVYLLMMRYYPGKYMIYFLVMIIFFMIWREKNKTPALITFFLSGILGIVVFDVITLKEPMLPMLSGLFGIPTLVLSIRRKEHIPPQKTDMTPINVKSHWKELFLGQLTGFMTAVFPGLSSGIAATVSSQLTKLDDRGMLFVTGVISSANLVISIGTLYVLGKARNGSIVAIQQLIEVGEKSLIILLIVALVVSILSFYLVICVGKAFCRLIERIRYSTISFLVISLLFILVLGLNGVVGLAVLLASCLVGLFAAKTGISRTHCMGCILIPVIIYLSKF